MSKDACPKLIFVFLITFSSLLIGCNPVNNALSELKLTFTGCDSSAEGEEEYILIRAGGKDIFINHFINYPCCANISVTLKEKVNILNIYEENTGGVCKCICNYKVDTALLNIAPGDYNLNIYGIGFNDTPFVEPTYSVKLKLPLKTKIKHIITDTNS